MKVYGSLERASFEALTSDPSAGVTGRFWFNLTEGRAKLDDGTLIRALLRNDQKLILGNSGTAADNIRLHRGAAGVLQFVSGADSTAEGSMSTALNQLSARVENYANFASLPAVGNVGRIAYVSSETQAYIDNGTAWEKVGSGSGSANNLMAEVNPDFEISSIAGWVKGNVTLDATTKFPSGTPTFGSGASGTLAITAQSSGALDGAYSLQYADSAATTAGNFVASDAFSVSPAYRAQPLAIAFKYSVTAGAANGVFAGNTTNSFGIAIYDVTNSQFIQPSGCWQIFQSSGVGTVLATFQTSATGASYRLVVYNANATSGAITLLMDNFYVGPQNVAYGVPVSDWQEFTPTASWVSNITWTGKWKRVGDVAKIKYYFILTNTTENNDLTINLPAGMVIDTSKLLTTDQYSWALPGLFNAREAGVGQKHHGRPIYNNTTSFTVYFPTANGATNPIEGGSPTSAIAPFTWGAGDFFEGEIEVPIQGWASNTVMSSDTSASVVAASIVATGSTTAAGGSAETKIAYNSVVKADGIDFDTSTNTATVRIPGWYNVTASMRFDTAAWSADYRQELLLYKNGVSYSYLDSKVTYAGTYYPGALRGTKKVYLLAGDTISVYVRNPEAGNRSTLTDSSINYLDIERVSGPATIAASEDVSIKYSTDAGQAIGTSDTVILFEDKHWDTHGAYNPSTGIFKAPVPGKYRITAGNHIATYATKGIITTAYVNGVAGDRLAQSIAGMGLVTGVTEVECEAGTEISVYGNIWIGAADSLANLSYLNYLIIEKMNR